MEHTTRAKTGSKRSAAQSRPLAPVLQPLPTWITPDLAPLQRLAADLSQFTLLPVKAQRQAVRPVFQAAHLQRAEEGRLTDERMAVQRQLAAFPPGIQPHVAIPVPNQPISAGHWVTVMRQQAEQIDGQRLSSREHDEFIALQRQVAQRLVQGFRQDRQAPDVRYAQYGDHLATLQRHPNSASVSRVVLNMVPQREQLPLQRAVDQARQRQMNQEAQEQAAAQRHTLQRKTAELDEEALQPVFRRVQARRGVGNPLPAAIQRHLEQGLNHDLSRVRIHDDAEADKLSKKVNALAFTTGTDIFFQSGQFNPNTQSGLELLAHEVTHTVQQSKGLVGTGVDPDAGLETEARTMGAKLAQIMPSPKSLLPPNPHAPSTYTTGAALSRVQQGAVTATLHQPFAPLGMQRQAAGITLQRNVVLDKVSDVAAHLPGYRELCLAFGQDLVTGKRLDQNPNAILDALGNLVPGPFKSMLQAVRQQNLIPKAWAWFEGELGTLKLGSVLSEVKGAIGKFPPDFGAAKAALTRRAEGLKRLVAGSARHLAQIALTAIEAGLGPVGKKVMGLLRQGGDVIVQVLRDPAKFAHNLLKALSQGFGQFRTNAGQWLQKGLGTWLTGASGVSFPATLDLKGVFLTALSVMGLTYQALRGRLVKELQAGGEQKVAAAEKAGGVLASLTKGLHLAPELKGQQSSIGQGVVDGLKGEVTRSLVTAGAAKVASMLVPGGVFVQALLTAFQGVHTLIGQGGQIMGVILNALGSVKAIAAGQVGAAAGFIERTIGGSVPIVLTFLGKLVGLGNIGTRIKTTVKKLRTRLDAKVDQLVGRIKKTLGSGNSADPKAGTAQNAPANTMKTLTAKIQPKSQAAHTLIFNSDGKTSSLMIHSRPRTFNEFITNIPIDAQHVEQSAIPHLNQLKAKAIQTANDIDSHHLNRQTTAGHPAVVHNLQALAGIIETIMEQFKQHHVSIVRFGGLQNGEGTWMDAKVLNQRYLEGNKPQDRDDSALYRTLNAARPKAWVRGHLLNEGLGGPGAAYNLVTLTQAANNRSGQSHYHLFEKQIKAAVMAGKTVRYNVRARYGVHPLRAVQQQQQSRLATLPPGQDRQQVEQLLRFLKFEQEEVALGLSVQWSELTFDNTSFTWTSMGQGSSGDVDNVLPETLPASANLPRSVTP